MRKSLKHLFGLLDPRDRAMACGLLVLMFIGSLFEVVGVGSVPLFIKLVSDPTTLEAYPVLERAVRRMGVESQNELIVFGSVFLIAFFAFKNGYVSLLHVAKARFAYNKMERISNRLFAAYLHAPYTFHLERNSAELVRNITQEVRLAVAQVLYPGLSLCMEMLVIVGIFAALLVVEPVVAIGAFLVLGVTSFGFLHLIRTGIRTHGQEEQRQRSRMIQVINQSLGGIKDVRVLGREAYFERHLADSVRRTTAALQHNQIASQLPKPVIETIAVASMLMVVLMLVAQGRPFDSVIPVLILFGAAAVRLMPSFKEAVASITKLRYNLFAASAIYRDLSLLLTDASADRAAGGGRTVATRVEKDIVIEDVHYRYPGASGFAVEGVNVTIPAGTAIGVVGSSGAGKSTLIDVLIGILEPTRGRVLADGRDVKRDLDAWRQNIGYVPQTIYLQDDTIARNIAFGLDDSEVDRDSLEAACRAAHLEEWIADLPEGLDTIVGDRGVRLSGGQRQRIGIARALYNDPQILVLDEATSALDNTSERYVMEAVERLRGDRTIIIIAHRLTTVRECDKLLYMKNGRVHAVGTFDELKAVDSGFFNIESIAVAPTGSV